MRAGKMAAIVAAVSMLAAISAQAVFAADTVTISAEKVTTDPGAEFSLDVSLSGVPATGLNAIEFAVTYDPSVVTVTGVSAGAIAQTAADSTENFEGAPAFAADFETAGTVTLIYSTGLFDTASCVSSDGVFATITGTASADAAAGDSTPVEIVPISRDTTEGSGVANSSIVAGYVGEDGTAVKCDIATEAGSVTIGGGGENPTDPPSGETLYGDADVDGKVDLADVIYTNKHMMGLDGVVLTEQGKTNADMNADGTITTEDALNILRVVVELVSSADFPIA